MGQFEARKDCTPEKRNVVFGRQRLMREKEKLAGAAGVFESRAN